MTGGSLVSEQDEYKRKFLVIIDDTEECDRAVTFAAYRVRRTGGTVVLMGVIEPDDFQHWLGVEKIMRAEALEEVERLLDLRTARIATIGKIKVETVVREGRKAEEIEKLIDEDKDIAILVLAAGTSSEGPGPLVSAFASRGATALPIPVTIIPGGLSDDQIAAVC
ncbi:universal stress protein [Mariluticola halotolerans]|uniref:universal stress protein n=1 Tax=Mariluticola halotolerans TaxID=2909283 RepID=UPI0026E46687|nr:universal stress protein [Mariluticola halotolerans]UJQ93512.1 universal stress protein [Mariluticola halotolerans]